MSLSVLVALAYFALGGALGALVVWVWQRAALAVAHERASRAEALLVQQQDVAASSRKELEDAFKALAATALASNREAFLALAEQKLGTVRVQAQADLDERKVAIETLLRPLAESLTKLETRSSEVEKARIDAYAKIDTHVQMLAQATAGLQEKTTTLATALKSSQTRGRWGEIALRNIAELAGMTEHCDFTEQTTNTEGGRPDMVVRLPGGRFVAVDAKVPLDAYLEANGATDDKVREQALDRHVSAMRKQVAQLARREYAAALGANLDLVVLFVPGDPILAAAYARDPDLQTDALRSKVLIATPTTLVALLRTMAIYWQQRALADNAMQIAETARDLYEKAALFAEHLGNVGRHLTSAVHAYNSAVGSFDSRLMPMGRKLDELKVSEQTKRRIEAPAIIDEATRELGSPRA
ncbi:MAG: DNA recombination protein RmuC [Myxococcota bacterium]